MIITKAELDSFLKATNAAPHSFLGMHPAKKARSQGVVVRAFLREASACSVIDLATDDNGEVIWNVHQAESILE